MTNPFDAHAALGAMAAPKPGPAAVSPLKDAAFNQARSLAEAAIAQGLDAVLGMVADLHQTADRMWAETRATPAFALGSRKAACDKGCGWCCHQRVGTTAPELLYIARELNRLPDRDAHLARLEAWPQGRACAFLVEGACSIYGLRPLKCRGLYQYDARWCMTTYAKLDAPLFGAAPDPGYQAPPKDIYDGFVFGHALAFHRVRRDCPGLDFIPALKAVIRMDGAAADWWAGSKRVFPAEARLHDWFPPLGKAKSAR
jgi:Fe-S-cluster containining protein